MLVFYFDKMLMEQYLMIKFWSSVCFDIYVEASIICFIKKF